MRVTAYCQGYPPTVCNGSEEYLRALLDHLCSVGHTAKVIAPLGVVRFQVGPVEVFGEQLLGLDRALLAKVLDETDVGLTYLDHHKGPRKGTLFSQKGIPFAYIIHSVGCKTDPDAGLLIANTETLLAHHQADVVLHPVVWGRDYANERPGSDIALINSCAQKGSNVFVAVASQLPKERFLAVRGFYGAQLARSGCPRNMRMVPRQRGPAQMRELYRDVGILLLPSGYESYGRVCLEAAASGIPVIAMDHPGVREGMGDAAVYCKTDRPAEWVAAVKRVRAEYPRWQAAALGRFQVVEQRSRDQLVVIEQRLSALRLPTSSPLPAPATEAKGPVPLG